MTTALLVVAHGSPRPDSNEDIRRVVDLVRAGGRYGVVELGFLDCNEPSIPDAVARCVAAGAMRVVVVPYFLHTGNHVAADIPDLLDAARERHPGVEILLSAFLGKSPRVADLLARRARDAADW